MKIKKSGHPSAARFDNMKGRCSNILNPDYADYGGRGIRVVGELNDFSFYATYLGSLPNAYSAGLSIDRIDNNGNYEVGNLRWADDALQASNKRPYRTGWTRTNVFSEEHLIEPVVRVGWLGQNAGAKAVRTLGFICSSQRYRKIRDEIWPEGKPS